MKKRCLLPVMALACAMTISLPVSGVSAANLTETEISGDKDTPPADEPELPVDVHEEVNKDALAETIQLAEEALGVGGGGWTEESANAVSYSLVAALKVLDNKDATQKEVDDANASLVAAVKALQPVASKKEEPKKEEPKQDNTKKMPKAGAGAAELLSLIAIGGASALGLRRKNR